MEAISHSTMVPTITLHQFWLSSVMRTSAAVAMAFIWLDGYILKGSVLDDAAKLRHGYVMDT